MELERIAVAVDFSPLAESAARWTAHGLAPQAAVDLVHCIDLPHVPAFLRGVLPHQERWFETLRRGAAERLEELAADIDREDVATQVLTGHPYRLLSDLVHGGEYDCLVTGAHAKRPDLTSLLGSVPERLVLTSPVPVLVARALPDGPPKTLLVPVDDSKLMPAVLEVAEAVSEGRSRLILVHVVSKWFSDQTRKRSGDDEADRLLATELAKARDWLEQVAQRTELRDAPEVELEVTAGSYDREILALAEKRGADLIVMGTRGSSGLAPPFIGSCARYVLRNHPGSTLFVTRAAD